MKSLFLILATMFCIIGATKKINAQPQIISGEQCKKIVNLMKSGNIGETTVNYYDRFLFWWVPKWKKQVTVMVDCQLWKVMLVKPTKDFPVQFMITGGSNNLIYNITPSGKLFLALSVYNDGCDYIYTPNKEYMPSQPGKLDIYVKTMKNVFTNIGS